MAENVQLRLMKLEDIDHVLEVEKSSFPSPWTRDAFYNELLKNHFAYYVVAQVGQKIVGYCGVWLIMDEAHITNIAVHPEYRGRKIGKCLLRNMMVFAQMQGAKKMTLEVRPSNHAALNLYEQLGFVRSGIRKGYYTDNHEDAIIMWADLEDEDEVIGH